jgi:hypothetical protein
MVSLLAIGPADIVQERTALEQKAFGRAHLVKSLKAVEKRKRQFDHVMSMLPLVLTASG